MELSGLIFVALALVWAVVLIPKALRSHDEVAKTRSVDQVSDAARVLARREAVTDREARLVVPSRTPAASSAASNTPPALPPSPQVPGQRRPVNRTPREELTAHRAAAAAAARRRRHVLLLLVLVVLAVGAATGVGALPLWAPAIPAGLTLGFLVLARVLVIREHARWDRAVADRRTAMQTPAAVAPLDTPVAAVDAAPVEAAAAEVSAAGAGDSDQRIHQTAPVISGLGDTPSLPVVLHAESQSATDPGTLWDPLPVTLPTYVSKPKAARSVRTIDLTDPRISSSGRDAADSALVAEAASGPGGSEDADQRAVGS